jgi:hypothetical protein
VLGGTHHQRALAFPRPVTVATIDVVAGEIFDRATMLGALSLVFRKVDTLQPRLRVARIGNGVEGARRLPLNGSRRRETEHGLRGR